MKWTVYNRTQSNGGYSLILARTYLYSEFQREREIAPILADHSIDALLLAPPTSHGGARLVLSSALKMGVRWNMWL